MTKIRMNKPLIKTTMKKWALDMHKFNEHVDAHRLYRVIAMTFYKQEWDAIHPDNLYNMTDKELRDMKLAYSKLEKIEKEIQKIAFEVIEEIEQTGIELD